VTALSPSGGRAAEPSEPTTFRECYKSIRSCQKSRCRTLDGEDQVTCIRQCNREYETCVSGAGGSSGSVLDFPGKLLTPAKPKPNPKPRDMHRNKLEGGAD
jgi:hypothetical protein